MNGFSEWKALILYCLIIQLASSWHPAGDKTKIYWKSPWHLPAICAAASIFLPIKSLLINNYPVFVLNSKDLPGKKLQNPKSEHFRNRRLTNYNTSGWFLQIRFLALSKAWNQIQWRYNIPTWDSNDYQLVLSSEVLQPERVVIYHTEGFQGPCSGVVTPPQNRSSPCSIWGWFLREGGLLHAGESSVFSAPSPQLSP